MYDLRQDILLINAAISHLESGDDNSTFSISQDSYEVKSINSNEKLKQNGRNHCSCSLQASDRDVHHLNTHR